MNTINLDFSNASISEKELLVIKEKVNYAHKILHNRTGLGNDFMEWIDYPNNYDKEEFERIKKVAKRINGNSDVFIVLGIGGSYLGSRAVISALTHSFYNLLPKAKRETPEIYFAGNNISGTYLKELLDVIKDKDITINVISKSGNTTETAIAFRIMKNYLENKYGKKEASKRIIVTTDKEKSDLRQLAERGL